MTIRITEQQRIDGQRKRRERRDQLIAESDKLKLDWYDKPEWERLASHYGVRLPAWYEPAHSKFARKALKKVGLKQGEYEELTGHKIQDTIKMNPQMPGFALVGLVLEDIKALYPEL